MKFPGLERPIGVLVLLLTAVGVLCSRLVFAPVPWPDGAAFFLPAGGLFAWNPAWLMHNQAAFVPSYDQANFNIMPAFSFYLGLGTRLGLGPWLGSVFAIKALSFFPVLLWAWILWRWLARERVAPWIAASAALAALWDPTVRWGAIGVRPEPVIGVLWALILVELSRGDRGRLWLISTWLALAAYFHYEAVYLVPGLAIALLPSVKKVWGVGWRTFLFLLPWVVFALLYYPLFISQMEIAFHRLSHGNRWVANPYLFFHSLFLWLGSPEGTPKFFNLGKAIFWALALALSVRAVISARKPDGFLRLGAAMSFWMGLLLWLTKPELWYTTICHVTLWSWVALELVLETRRAEPAPQRASQPALRWKSLSWACAASAALGLLATVGQAMKIPETYTRENYRAWVDCIENQTEAARKITHTVRIWQPNFPDVLVELADRHRDYDLTRALDFEVKKPEALAFGRRAEVIIFSRLVGANDRDYSGPERIQDLMLITQNDTEMPFGPWAARDLEAEETGRRERHVCQVGPFWADVFRRRQ